jgi:hypothetical protein
MSQIGISCRAPNLNTWRVEALANRDRARRSYLCPRPRCKAASRRCSNGIREHSASGKEATAVTGVPIGLNDGGHEPSV